jgi:ornithine--oxo-acid transaminase
MYRTGPFLAAQHFNLEPDMVVMAKALSGGLIPVAAVLMSDEVNRSVYNSLKRAIVHTSTYSENALAMRAALATLDVLESHGSGEYAVRMGNWLRTRLTARLSHYEMIREIRGVGMLTGVEFQPPSRLRLRIVFEAFARVHPAMFGQVLVMRLFRDKSMLTQICGNNFMVLKIAPALTISEEQVVEFIDALGEVVNLMHSGGSFWSEPLGMVGRIIKSV